MENILHKIPSFRRMIGSLQYQQIIIYVFNFRILFGGNHLYVFVNPKKKGVKSSQEITYDMAQKEIAKQVGGLGGTILNGKRSKGLLLKKIFYQPSIF